MRNLTTSCYNPIDCIDIQDEREEKREATPTPSRRCHLSTNQIQEPLAVARLLSCFQPARSITINLLHTINIKERMSRFYQHARSVTINLLHTISIKENMSRFYQHACSITINLLHI